MEESSEFYFIWEWDFSYIKYMSLISRSINLFFNIISWNLEKYHSLKNQMYSRDN